MNSFSHNMHQLKDKGNINWFKCSFTKILYFTLLFRAFSILPEPVTSSVTKAFLKMPKFRKKNFFLRLKLDRQPRTSQVYPFLSLEFLKSKNYFFPSPLLPLLCTSSITVCTYVNFINLHEFWAKNFEASPTTSEVMADYSRVDG